VFHRSIALDVIDTARHAMKNATLRYNARELLNSAACRPVYNEPIRESMHNRILWRICVAIVALKETNVLCVYC
jgi:hypothetical protein